MRRRYAVMFLVALAALISGGTTSIGSARAATLLYPNLEPFPATDFSIDQVALDFNNPNELTTVLRFSTLSWNQGDGPLQLWADQDSEGNRAVFQEVLRSDGSFYRFMKPAGDFKYHEEHAHFHFEDYASYVLHRPDDPSLNGDLASGTKTTFCIMDTNRIDHKMPGAPKRSAYSSCGLDLQGMSVGWGDRYGASLWDQWVDLTDLLKEPDKNSGDWVLTIAIDPANVIVESTELSGGPGDANESQVTVCLNLEQLTVSEGTCDGSGAEEPGPGPGNGNGNGRGRPSG